jgi:hypothetical protein
VWKLHKSLYGLKQAPQCWNEKLDGVLKAEGFMQSLADPALYIKKEGDKVLWLVDFVDDMLMISPSQEMVKKTKHLLQTKFELTDMDEASYYLKMHIKRNRERRELWLGQANYCKKVVEKFGLWDEKPTSTPLPPNFKTWYAHEKDKQNREPPEDSPYPHDPLLNKEHQKLYRQMIGSVGYAAHTTRPDLAHAFAQLSQVQDVPRERHLAAVKHCIRYMRGTLNLCLHFKGEKGANLEGFTDADFAGCHGDARSTGAYMFRVAGAPIHWSSKKQDCVTKSTCEAEYMALSNGTSECVWLRDLLHELTMTQDMPTPMYIDNESAWKVSLNPVKAQTTKHVRVAFHYVREKQRDGVIRVVPVKSKEQCADYLTKAMNLGPFNECKDLVSQSIPPE